MKRALGDIRTWIALVFLMRLIGIEDPPLEMSHSWRQAFTNMVARNLAEGPFDLLHPRTDMAGERPDVVASEFPGLNAIIAIMYRTWGPAHWYGRLVVLLCSTLGTWSFYLLVRRHYRERIAFLATVILIWSSWFIYGRKSMPDVFSIALVLIAVDAADRAVAHRQWRWFLLAVPAAALGGLCKIPAMVLCAPWALTALNKELPGPWRRGSGVAFSIAIAPVIWWYFHWQPHLLSAYHNQLYFPFGLRDGFESLVPFWAKVIERFRFSALMSHVAFAALLFGVWRSFRSTDKALGVISLAVMLPFVYFILKAGSVFAIHAYYILPIVPLMALFAGTGLSALPAGRWTIIALMLVVVEAAGNRWSDITGGAEREHLLRAEQLADRFTDPEDLVATTDGLDPRPMYYLHRHGWCLEQARSIHRSTLDSLQRLGLVAVFVDRHTRPDPLPWDLLWEDADWRVYGPPKNDAIIDP